MSEGKIKHRKEKPQPEDPCVGAGAVESNNTGRENKTEANVIKQSSGEQVGQYEVKLFN